MLNRNIVFPLGSRCFFLPVTVLRCYFSVSPNPCCTTLAHLLAQLKRLIQPNKLCRLPTFIGASIFGRYTAWWGWFLPTFHFATDYRCQCVQPYTRLLARKFMA